MRAGLSRPCDYYRGTGRHAKSAKAPIQINSRLKGVIMANHEDRTAGAKKIVEKCREIFRQKENLDHYAEEDLKSAERKFIRYCLLGRT